LKAPGKTRRSGKTPELFLNRELSWLEFNARVVEEATDPANPILERLKFAIIASSNLDEFFMVRVAALKNAMLEGDITPDVAGLTPARQLHLISDRAQAMVAQLGATLMDDLLPGLAQHGVRVATLESLDEPQRSSLARYYRVEVLPALTPLAIDTSRPFPQLASLTLNLALLLAPMAEETERRLAVVQVPARLRRLVRPVGGGGNTYVLLEDIIRTELASLFPGQTVLESAAFRIARDAEMEFDDEGGSDYLEVIEEGLRDRRRSQVVRLEVQAGVGDELLEILCKRLEVGPQDIYHVRGPLDTRALQPLLDAPSLENLRETPLKPVPVLDPREQASIFQLLDDHDILLHHPYDSYDPVITFLATAADDPDVLAIKQTLYRASGDSPIVRALARAAEQGKQVTVLVEVMARFDEQSNIRWARSLEASGAHVIFGIRGYKTHAKICLVVRRGQNGIQRYVHLGTGNYNERTARVYTDFGFMTSDAAIGEDASSFFNALTGYSDPPRMKKLTMAPTGLRERILKLIARERKRAEEGQAAEIRAKMNALVDEDIIRALYDASRAGVRIRLNVRGVCCLKPGVKGLSDTIEVVSIVDRFLEHARIAYFRNGGDEEVYLSSADWMPRNLDRRIELLFPVGAACRPKIMEALDAMFQDNVKSRRLLPDGAYRRRRPLKGEEPFSAQLFLYRQAVRAAERARAATEVVFEPLSSPVDPKTTVP
jgi:polyphosphate kinase